jgi:polyphosphate kinase
LTRELRFERRGIVTPLGNPDLYPVSGWLDHALFHQLADALPPEDHFPSVAPRMPFSSDRSVFDLIDQGDLLVQHPADAFEGTVVRFIETAAHDPQVMAIKITLYRAGDDSPILHALVQAARAGIDVFAFVEVRARLDEERNTQWVKRLEAAGVHVVYGIVGLKIHAKAALVVRRTPLEIRRYVHVGTGNYNAATARRYTDLGLFTSDPQITADVIDFFNSLSGATIGPQASFRRLLVAPEGMAQGLIERIRREAEHARAGRPARIRAQLNGLDAPDVITELYRASEAGVTIELVVRGLCALRPGVKGLSDGITVKSILGRYLEHQRIVHFHNGGLDEYWIGSADWRTRNLHRRVEIMAPVTRRDLKVRLGAILDRLWAETSAWTLGSDGRYRQAPADRRSPHVHDAMFDPDWPFGHRRWLDRSGQHGPARVTRSGHQVETSTG